MADSSILVTKPTEGRVRSFACGGAAAVNLAPLQHGLENMLRVLHGDETGLCSGTWLIGLVELFGNVFE
ncbi:MAG: hypothetical protein ACI9W2_000304 [Gammaproteobacteria bacterium]|jgi:hypothetical protein